MRENDVRRNMKKGMISLLTKMPYSDMTVTDLIRESHVARASFYRIYSKLIDVIDELVDDFTNKIETFIFPILKASDEATIRETLKGFFTGVKEEKTLFVDILPENINFFLSRLNSSSLLDKNKKYKDIEEKYDRVLAFINVFSIVHIWRYFGYQESIDDMVDYSYDVVLKIYKENGK